MKPFAIMLAAASAVCAVAQTAPQKNAVPADAQTKKDMANLARLSNQRDAAKVAMMKHKGNASNKSAFLELNDLLANKTMTAGWLSPHEKYSKALRLYRFSLSVDPGDREAKNWVDQIESIYRSMHRPIPK